MVFVCFLLVFCLLSGGFVWFLLFFCLVSGGFLFALWWFFVFRFYFTSVDPLCFTEKAVVDIVHKQ